MTAPERKSNTKGKVVGGAAVALTASFLTVWEGYAPVAKHEHVDPPGVITWCFGRTNFDDPTVAGRDALHQGRVRQAARRRRAEVCRPPLRVRQGLRQHAPAPAGVRLLALPTISAADASASRPRSQAQRRRRQGRLRRSHGLRPGERRRAEGPSEPAQRPSAKLLEGRLMTGARILEWFFTSKLGRILVLVLAPRSSGRLRRRRLARPKRREQGRGNCIASVGSWPRPRRTRTLPQFSTTACRRSLPR
jgi:hypothetical protein